MRLIYDGRTDGNLFPFAGMLLALSGALFFQSAQPSVRTIGPLTPEVRESAWRGCGIAGGICLVLGLILRMTAVRIAADESGIRFLTSWGRNRWLLRWADVRSWRVESYQKHDFESVTRLVIELTSTQKPRIVTDYWQVIAAELRARLPQSASPACTARVSERRAVSCLSLVNPPTFFGFRWEDCAQGLSLKFPPPDRRPHVAVTRWLCLGTGGALIVSSVLVVLGKPFGDRLTVLMVVLAVVGGVVSAICFVDDAVRRKHADRAVACLTIGPEGVKVEDRAGRGQSWSRTAILAVNVDSCVTGDIEPGNSQICYTIQLRLADGSSVPLWSRTTRDDFPLFRVTEYDESNIQSVVNWLSSTIGQALELPGVAIGETTAGK